MSPILKGNSEMGQGTEKGHQVEDSGGLSSAMTEGGARGVHQFKWNQQGSRVLEQLKVLYNHPEGAGAVLSLQPDVVLVSSDGGCVEAHRMVLSLCSAYFQDLFVKVSQVASPRMKDGPAVVVLGNVKTCQLQQLLQFLYTGEVTVPSDQLEEFLEMGNAFQIEEIMGFKSSIGNLSATQRGSSLTLNAGDAKTNTMIGVSEDVNKSPVASSSTPILFEDVPDENMEISYDSYPVKVEEESEVTLDPLDDSDSTDNDNHEDPTWSGEDNQPSSASEMEEDDPTYEEKSAKTKRRRMAADNPSIAGVVGKSQQVTKVDWEVQEAISDETLKLEWRVKHCGHSESGTASTYYYCSVGGKPCPARLKKKALKDGTVIWLSNRVSHSPHPKASRQAPGSDWEVQDPVSDEILQLNWRVLRNRRLESGGVTTYYYCAIGGRQCPVKLKKKVSNDGTVVWFHNHATHNFHPGTDSARQKQPQCKPKRINLTPEQSQFVLQCLEGGVTSLNDIVLKFKVHNQTLPEEQHLRAFLRYHQHAKNL